MVRAFRERHDHVVGRLNQLRGVRCLPAQGTFYAFALFKDAIANFEGIANDVDMAELILNEAGVALVPGSAFGAEGYMRLSFATSPEKLDQALDRLEKLLGRADA
jgi:aspartate aminotransferase